MSFFHRSRSTQNSGIGKSSIAFDHFDFKGGKASEVLGEQTTLERSWSIASTVYRRGSDDTASSSDRLPSSLSQASTLDMPSLDHDLEQKASSVLLRKDFKGNSHTSDSSRSHGVRERGSSTTLHDHYDANSAPLAISQQTSASSARDMALRKGATPIAKLLKPKSGAKESSTLKKQRSDHTLTRRKAKPAAIDISTLFPRPDSAKHSIAIRGREDSSWQSKPTNMSEASSTKSTLTVKPEDNTPIVPRSRDGEVAVTTAQQAQGRQINSMYPKLNVRKPRAGVKDWFDELDDQSEDERHSEPDFQSNFVEHIETAFKNGDIRPRTAPEKHSKSDFDPETFLESPPSRTPQQLSVTGDKATRVTHGKTVPNLDLKIPQTPFFSENIFRLQAGSVRKPRTKPNRLEVANLDEESVLCLSSSDDEEPEITISPKSRAKTTVIRDSLAIDPVEVTEIEIGTAKAVSKQELNLSQTPQFKRLRSVRKDSQTSTTDYNVPTRRSSRMFSYLNDTPSDSRAPSTITSFPSDFSDVDSDDLASESIRSSLYTDPDNTRLMTVTRQEELLLAAMRAKRAHLGGKVSRASMLSDGSSRKSFKLYHPTPRNLQAGTPVAEQLDRGLRPSSNTSGSVRFRDLNSIREYYHRSGVRSRGSGNTLHGSMMSTSTFRSSSTQGMADECLSSPDDSQESPKTPHAVLEAETLSQRSGSVYSSDATASPVSQHQHTRRRTDSGNIVVLDDLDDAPRRETLSQDFIEWPYTGWNSRVGLAMAH